MCKILYTVTSKNLLLKSLLFLFINTSSEADYNCNRNLKISKALLKSQAHQVTSLFTSAATNQRVFSKGRVKRSSGPISRIPGGDRVAFKVGVIQMEKVVGS